MGTTQKYLLLLVIMLLSLGQSLAVRADAPAPASAPAAPAPAGPPALELIKDIEAHGFASTAYVNNFNNPVGNAGGHRVNNFRAFDINHNSFTLDTGELALLKQTPKQGDVGFMADLYFGYTIPRVTMSAAPGNTIAGTNNAVFDVKQGFVSYNAPVGNGLTLDLGKFITHLGAEVIEGYSAWNPNYSRSFLFTMAIPFTHTGLRAKYAFNDKFNVLGMVSNTMDNTVSPTSAKDLGVALNFIPNDTLSLIFNWCGGAAPQPMAFVPRPNNSSNRRDIFDVVATITATDKLSFLLNYDYGVERNGSPLASFRDAHWDGFSGIVRYKLDDFVNGFSLNLRGETFNDPDGLRTGAFMTALGGLPSSQNLWEVTFTPELIINRNLILRGEYRHDESDIVAFSSNTLALGKKYQDTIAVNAMFFF